MRAVLVGQGAHANSLVEILVTRNILLLVEFLGMLCCGTTLKLCRLLHASATFTQEHRNAGGVHVLRAVLGCTVGQGAQAPLQEIDDGDLDVREEVLFSKMSTRNMHAQHTPCSPPHHT